jgi:ATP-dependent Clp endopeptidase proteolytic subunit ClpP
MKNNNNLVCIEAKISTISTMDDLPFVYVTDFNDAAVKDFYINVKKLENDPGVIIIPIMINSYGGSVYSLLAMLDILSCTTKPICTVAMGKAMSCGSVLLAAGTPGYRYMGKNAHVMIHEVSSFAMGKTTEVKEDIKNTERLNDILLTKLGELCKKKDKKFFHKEIKKRTNLDWFMEGKECKKLGLVDVVGMPYFLKK